MHMLQERLGSVALPPLQMPALSASWPPIGGMISPGLSSPGTVSLSKQACLIDECTSVPLSSHLLFTGLGSAFP